MTALEPSQPRFQHTINAVILRRQFQTLENITWNTGQRPDGFGIVLSLRGEIGFGKNFKGITARFFFGQIGDALLQFGEGGQSSKQFLLNEAGCFGMSRRCHRKKIINLVA